MTSETPFHPIPIPEGLLLSEAANSSQHPKTDQTTEQTKQERRSRTRRKARRQTCPGIDPAGTYDQCRWQRIKGRFTALLCSMDPETLKRILTAAGVAAG